MIFVLKLKDFLRNKKKLVEPKDYIIFDVTDDTSGELSKFANTISLVGMKPPRNLSKLVLKSEESDLYNSLDFDKIEKLEKRFFKGTAFLKSVDTLLVSAVRKDQNIFIVLADKDYKAYGERIIVEIKRYAGDNKVVFSIDDIEDSSKILRRMLSSGDIAAMTAGAEKVEKKIEKLEEERSEEKEKKKKKDKKKKKKKKNKWLDF